MRIEPAWVYEFDIGSGNAPAHLDCCLRKLFDRNIARLAA